MGGILEYVENNMVVMSLLLAAVLAVIIIWNLYLKEKKEQPKLRSLYLESGSFTEFLLKRTENFICVSGKET